MTLVRASIDIDAPPEQVYDLVLDPARLNEWVTIHRRVNSRDAGEPHEGYEMEQTLHLRGANFKVHWTLTEADRPGKATWEGRGPAHSYARTSYALTRGRRRQDALRVRERVQGARRLSRRGGEPDADRRRARTRGHALAPAPESAARGLGIGEPPDGTAGRGLSRCSHVRTTR